MSIPQSSQSRPQAAPSALTTWLIFFALFFTVYFASLFTPPLMDDVDASHAQTAQHIIDSGNWVTTQTNGIRYIEKPPLPFWLVTISYKLFGENAFATHLPNALAILGLTWLAWLWARRAWNARAGLYAGLAVLTSIGPFLFTRFIIPESILSLLLLIALYSLLTSLEDDKPARVYWAWAALALALLIKGLIAPVFFFGGVIPYLWLSGQGRRWRELKPLTGSLLFLAIAAPWHILVGLANRGEGHPVGNHPTLGNVHNWWYFYFINEHVFRFFGKRYPHDYNKLPTLAYWLLHLVWLFPWSLFLPALFAVAWKSRRTWLPQLRHYDQPFPLDPSAVQPRFRVHTIWLLSLFSVFSLLFFSISTNQEYYTFPVWPPLFILIAGVMAFTEEHVLTNNTRTISTTWLTNAQAVFAIIGIAVAAALGWGLWDSRALPYVPDIGTLLAHRAVGNYTLSMSHFFDLTGPSFAAAASISPPPSASHSLRPSSSSPRTSRSRASRPCSAPNPWPKPSCSAALPLTPSSSWASNPTPPPSSTTPTTSSTASPPMSSFPAVASMAKVPPSSMAPATPTPPTSSSATRNSRTPGAPATASGSSPRTPTSSRPSVSYPGASTSSRP